MGTRYNMTHSDPATGIVVGILVLLIAAAIGVAVASARRRSERLQAHYGQEYERTLLSAGSRGAAEDELLAREQRRGEMNVRPLPGGLREGYIVQWKLVQARFVDDPRTALWDANRIVHQVMEARGYPVRNRTDQAEDLSVDYGPLVADYRKANAIALAARDGVASTEHVREAFLLYRSLFDALVESSSDAPSLQVS